MQAGDMMQTLLILVIIILLLIGFLWAFTCPYLELFGMKFPSSPLCDTGGGGGGGGDDDLEEEPPPDEVICEDLDDKLSVSATTYIVLGQQACILLGGNWLFQSEIVGCFDPFIPGRIYCPTVVTDPRWVDFAIACRDAGGWESCSRKFVGCHCPDFPMAAAECGWNYDHDHNGLFCGGVCNNGGSCTTFEGECLCKDENHIYCDEYLTSEGLQCFGWCEDGTGSCSYFDSDCGCHIAL